ncbi:MULTISPECIES: flavin reductase family protein [unclassified Rhizobium]|uniref:flavin reductase family protein n=1 Tax=unclassified Rhizobium TaxID=2613769 RepID=UPI001ADB13A1|nr:MULTISPECIES: flavin reductase family protein [unclassified Rhizobium]MBO9099641.1 flavin reductase family protein [Rhizobium sp. L58/93]QXZ86890.1 flavin reductase family protein [Rhizobium sp. K1/93]QXZ93077.1 flavin reductase family protein [Rhizobium sp. K15/93]
MTHASFDPRSLRDSFGAFLTGVTVVTTCDEGGRPIGFTANSFASVSLDPPLLLVCLAKTSRNFTAMTTAKGFAVNILAETQITISNTFAKPAEDRFASVEWRMGPYGAPILSGVAAWFDCSMANRVDAGDHVILIGRVEAFESGVASGLGYARGSYVTPALAREALSATAGGHPLLSAIIERNGEILLIRGDDGRWRLPQIAVEDNDPVAALQHYISTIVSPSIEIGFLYSVYGDKASGRQHIVYRGTAVDETTAIDGRFIAITHLPFDTLDNKPTVDLLRRFASERALGNFGVYFGDETQGTVHQLARKV